MKKMLAFFTAAMCCSGIFIACGNKESSSTSESENTSAVTTSAKNNSQKENFDDEFEDIFRTFFMGGASDKMLEVSLPDDVIESMKNIGGAETISENVASSVAQYISAVPETDAEKIKYVSERECTPEFRSRIEELYSAYYDVYKTMDDIGISYEEYLTGKVDENRMNQLSEVLDRYGKICAGEQIDIVHSIIFEDVRLVTFSMNGDHVEFLMYKISGENWKLDTIGLAVFEY
ncbi:MAG: hypothetical protein IKK47_08065 [Ruminococcus sp.]|nr:hypothetical protein [Ruminococcus sp.]